MEKPRSDDFTAGRGLDDEDRGAHRHAEPEGTFPYVPFSALSGRREPADDAPNDFAPLSGGPAEPGLSADPTGEMDEAMTEESERNWNAMLDALKEYVERVARAA